LQTEPKPHVHLDLYSAKDSLQQNTPETGETFVQITHPYHPLAGQRVRVVRQTGPETARQWVIELDDQTRACIPLSWAVPDDDSSPPQLPPTHLWVDVTGLLKLARMVRSLCASEPTEVTPDEATSDRARDSNITHQTPPLLGEPAVQRTTGNNDSIDGHDGQTAAGPPSAGEG
jgi:hypothetical protein